ncbi:MAG: response regulator transcription factor [Clostridia bacterium]|nr:response regulator transcription factor [Clostridia bacterium]
MELDIVNENRRTVLIVDDEKPIVDILEYNLKKEGYNTLIANDGVEAVNIALEQRPNIILLDIMLPKMDGLTVCKKVRTALNIPIIMLTAKEEEIDKILGLELGADDYVTKPFSVRELIARIKANLRKYELSQGMSGEAEIKDNDRKITIGDLQLDLDKFEVKVRGKKVDLTVREFEVLRYLANQPGQVVSRELLLEKVWGYEYFGDIRTVDVTVRRIREKIEDDTTDPQILVTKRGIGYYIAKPEQ